MAGGASRGLSAMATSVKDCGAFIDRAVTLTGAQAGPLAGLTFAVKDLFDVKGFVTGFGNPTWKETHGPAEETAPPVQMLVDAGAHMVGKVHMDELAYSLNGENVHYGTPTNPAAPGRVPGGSSSGSAVAVANNEVDFSLGSDTAGSVRVPASYNGIFGFRPTHGRISLDAARPLAPSYDTCGWFARDAALLERVGKVLLGSGNTPQRKLRRWLWAVDGFAHAQPTTSQKLQDDIESAAPAFVSVLGDVEKITVASMTEDDDLSQWITTFRVLQGREAWECHGEWIKSAKPTFGPGTRERFEMTSKISAEEVAAAAVSQQRIREHLDRLLGEDGALFLPTAPGPAPLCNTPLRELDAFRKELLTLSSIASIGGLPQVSLPLSKVDGFPVGLGVIGPKGSDEGLLDLTKSLMEAFAD
eukprot:evm.model.scf_1163.3 EVM.evm.TU.scf_1163.3   scf_1163:18714-24112(-)